ncbi:MAG: polysaccharide pyruvyl transferase family protein [Acidobacteriia bacterium]|nr:polysaccharide pyruvyl transferase family protein [Terriglobia bacterium]
MSFRIPLYRFASKYRDRNSNERKRKRPRICLFGHFGQGNFGNESTLQAILYHLRRRIPHAEVACICTDPEAVAVDYNISAVEISGIVVKPWELRNPVARLGRKLFIGIPSEVYRWLKGVMTLWRTDALIIPGTGLLTDAVSLLGWGPYNMFKWSVISKLCGCKLFFVSVGAGPLYSRVGRCLVRSALSLADFRSYRDDSTLQYLKGIGFRAENDRVCPDLAFSLPAALIPHDVAKREGRSVVGLGLMKYPGRYSVEKPSHAIYLAYLDALVVFVRWLIAHDYDIRLLVGDCCDRAVTQDFTFLLKERSVAYEEGRIIDEPILSAAELLSQLAATDVVVATRFHNVLLALLLNKPVISISFHHKCVSLMSEMGLSEYWQDINDLSGERLIEQFCQLEKNAGPVKSLIRERAENCRVALDDQYSIIFESMFPGLAISEGFDNMHPTAPTQAHAAQTSISAPD